MPSNTSEHLSGPGGPLALSILLDNDTALDLKDTLATATDEKARREGLAFAVTRLAGYDPSMNHSDPHAVMQTGIGGCAIVADKVCGTYFYTDPPEDGEDFRLDMLPELDPEFREEACRAVARAMDLRAHPEMPAWDRPESSRNHSLALEELATRLHGHTEEEGIR